MEKRPLTETNRTGKSSSAGRKPARHTKKAPVSCCETCEFYDYDEEYGENVCTEKLDEDEMVDFLSGATGNCPYYRYYDEYTSVHKQI